MDRTLIKKYIDSQPQKVVAKLDLDKNKIEYQGILQGQVIKEIKGDEEMSRSFILTRLINELGYSPDRIEIEHEYTAGRPHTNTSRIDIIVRDADGNAFLFIECKSPDAYASDDRDQIIEEQLYKVAGMERTEGNSVRYLVLYTTAETSDKVMDECIIIDTDCFQKSSPLLLIGKYPETFRTHFLPDMAKLRRHPISKHLQRTWKPISLTKC